MNKPTNIMIDWLIYVAQSFPIDLLMTKNGTNVQEWIKNLNETSPSQHIALIDFETFLHMIDFISYFCNILLVCCFYFISKKKEENVLYKQNFSCSMYKT